MFTTVETGTVRCGNAPDRHHRQGRAADAGLLIELSLPATLP